MLVRRKISHSRYDISSFHVFSYALMFINDFICIGEQDHQTGFPVKNNNSSSFWQVIRQKDKNRISKRQKNKKMKRREQENGLVYQQKDNIEQCFSTFFASRHPQMPKEVQRSIKVITGGTPDTISRHPSVPRHPG